MDTPVFAFDVTGLDVSIEEGFKLNWQGRDIHSGRVLITLNGPGSRGTIDYASSAVKVDFQVRIELPELAELLTDMGADASLAAPVTGTIHSEGVVFEDHCFRLSGLGALAEHRVFGAGTKVEILAPTRCKPDKVALSGDQIRAALWNGEPVSWNFNPAEKRVVLSLPESLGGYTDTLCLAGSYTFTAARAEPRAVARETAPQKIEA